MLSGMLSADGASVVANKKMGFANSADKNGGYYTSSFMGLNAQNPNAGLYPFPSSLLIIHYALSEDIPDSDVYMMDYNDIVNNDTRFVKLHVQSPTAMDAYNFRMPPYTEASYNF